MSAIHNSVEVWLLSRERPPAVLLLLKYAVAGRHPAYWQPVTGGIQRYEPPEQAARREVCEETGWTNIQLLDIQTVVNFDTGRVKLVRHVFVGCVARQQPRLEQAEHEAWCWATPAQTPALLGQQSSRQSWSQVHTEFRYILNQFALI
jgi:dihydroneopterin triphosphate diphosphatase